MNLEHETRDIRWLLAEQEEQLRAGRLVGFAIVAVCAYLTGVACGVILLWWLL